MAATALMRLNGRVARIRRENRNGPTMLTYRDTLPDDLAPLLVLDASARVRQTYRWMEQRRGSAAGLTPATKNYEPLTIHAGQESGVQVRVRKERLTKGMPTRS